MDDPSNSADSYCYSSNMEVASSNNLEFMRTVFHRYGNDDQLLSYKNTVEYSL